MPLADKKPASTRAAGLVVFLLALAVIAAGFVLFNQIDRGLATLAAPSAAASPRAAQPVEASGPSVPAAADSDYFPSQFVNQAKDIEEQPPTF